MNLENWSCPAPAGRSQHILLGHGGGGRLSAELVEQIFAPAFDNPHLAELGDGAVLDWPGQKLALSTDSFVVQPLFFPGGCIGDLAVHGTVNDLAMMGARPLYLTAGFILEEGLEISVLVQVVEAMARAARAAGVSIVTGDTKVVERGHGDGIFINTSGVGLVQPQVRLGPARAQPGDVILLSGTMGDHGMAIMSLRQGLQFETELRSDCASLHELAAGLLAAAPGLRLMRDPTRGGVAAATNEIAQASRVGIELIEGDLPVGREVAAACEFLGLDPLMVANEGKMLAILPHQEAEAGLAALRAHPLGQAACRIGTVVDRHPGMVVVKTRLGGTRVVDLALGEPLPRIC